MLVLILALGTICRAQVPYFQHYNLLKKNEPVQVNAIFQDRTGYMWFGTSKGLFKFDGAVFTQYTLKDSLPDNNVTAINSDSLGRIWTGHKGGQLAYMENGIFKKFNPPEGDATQEISDILFDRRGVLWFSTLNDGLYYYRKGRLYRLDDSEGMPDLYVYDIVEDPIGNIWAGTDGGVAICTLSDSTVSIKTLNYNSGLPDNIVKKFSLDKDGRIWMATEDAGIIQYDSASSGYKKLFANKLNFGVISDFLIYGDQVWIAYPQSGLVVYNRKTKEVKEYAAKVDPGFGSVQILASDREANIWTGSKTDIMRTQGDHLEFIAMQNLLTDVNIVALTIDNQGETWFSTAEGLFRRHVGTSGKVSIVRPLAKSAFQKYSVISLYTDSYGYVWAGLYGEGVVRINPVTGVIFHFNKELRNGNTLSVSGKDDVVWLATLGGGTRIDISDNKLKIRNFTSEDGLISDYIYQIFIDSQDRVWFATDGRGVDMMDETGFHHYQEGLSSRVVYGFAEDNNHYIWVNVQGDGLYQFADEKFRPFDPGGKRLRDNNIGVFTFTPSGKLFIMHDLGIDIYNIKTNQVEFHGEESGIMDMKSNLNALTKDQSGQIYVGTDKGIIKYADFPF